MFAKNDHLGFQVYYLVLRPEDADEDGVPLIEPHAAGRHGPEQLLQRFANLRAEAAHLARVFARLHADGCR
jgi:hypothetical protein